MQVLRRLGVETTRNIANRMLPEIRQRSVLKKSWLSDEELIQIFEGTLSRLGSELAVRREQTGTEG